MSHVRGQHHGQVTGDLDRMAIDGDGHDPPIEDDEFYISVALCTAGGGSLLIQCDGDDPRVST